MNFCNNCGQKLEPLWIVCPQCGISLITQPKQQISQPYQQPEEDFSGKAIVYGIFAILLSIIPIMGILFALLAISSGAQSKGETGTVLGAIALILSGLSALFWMWVIRGI